MTKRPRKPSGTAPDEDKGLGATDEESVGIPGQTPEPGPSRPRRPPGEADREVGSDPPGPGPLLPT